MKPSQQTLSSIMRYFDQLIEQLGSIQNRPYMEDSGIDAIFSCFLLLNKLNELIDPTFDKNDLPYLNVYWADLTDMEDPISDIPFSSGMYPEDISNLALRHQYKQKLDENRQKSEYYHHQIDVRNQLETAMTSMHHILKEMMLQKPSLYSKLEEMTKSKGCYQLFQDIIHNHDH